MVNAIRPLLQCSQRERTRSVAWKKQLNRSLASPCGFAQRRTHDTRPLIYEESQIVNKLYAWFVILFFLLLPACAPSLQDNTLDDPTAVAQASVTPTAVTEPRTVQKLGSCISRSSKARFCHILNIERKKTMLELVTHHISF